MELVKEIWIIEDIALFNEYLQSLSKGKEKAEWEKRIVNTNLMCLAIPSQEITRIVKTISKGNYISFINLWIWDNLADTFIIGNLICKIKDFKIFKVYLTKYASQIDNWASCDTLSFKITDKNKNDFYTLATEYINSPLPFTRRTGLRILFKLLNYPEYLSQIFEQVDSLNAATEYYVNMMIAWLVAEAFIKHRDKTLEYLSHHKLNKFSINKAIQKCRDSYRVSVNDKQMLLKYKVN